MITRNRKSSKPLRFLARLSSKYQATVPKEIRNHLHLKSGDEIFYELLPDDTVIVRKVSSSDLEYLKALAATMNEWESKEDEEAYKHL